MAAYASLEDAFPACSQPFVPPCICFSLFSRDMFLSMSQWMPSWPDIKMARCGLQTRFFLNPTFSLYPFLPFFFNFYSILTSSSRSIAKVLYNTFLFGGESVLFLRTSTPNSIFFISILTFSIYFRDGPRTKWTSRYHRGGCRNGS